jgi:hypothetical protein
MFTSEDIPGYQVYSPAECTMCKGGYKLVLLITQQIDGNVIQPKLMGNSHCKYII